MCNSDEYIWLMSMTLTTSIVNLYRYWLVLPVFQPKINQIPPHLGLQLDHCPIILTSLKWWKAGLRMWEPAKNCDDSTEIQNVFDQLLTREIYSVKWQDGKNEKELPCAMAYMYYMISTRWWNNWYTFPRFCYGAVRNRTSTLWQTLFYWTMEAVAYRYGLEIEKISCNIWYKFYKRERI